MPRKTTRIDMHSHTRGSDGTGTPAQIALAASKAGLHGLCLTDHHTNETDEVRKVAKALRDVGIFPIIGCEYSTAQGHLLVYGVKVPGGLFGMYPEMQDVIDYVNDAGGACVVPHAYKGYKKTLRDGIFQIRGLAGVEVINGQVEQRDPSTNRKALDAATKMGLPMVAGSDAHFADDVGLCFTEFDGRIRGERAFLEGLKAGTFRPKLNEERFQKREKERAERDKLWRTSASRYKVPPAPLPPIRFGRAAPVSSFQNGVVTLNKDVNDAYLAELAYREQLGLEVEDDDVGFDADAAWERWLKEEGAADTSTDDVYDDDFWKGR